MSRVDYHKYLNSLQWDRIRRRRLRIARYRCEICGSAQPLQVHHKTYKRLGHEHMSDLQALCDKCHESQHTHPDHWQVQIAAMVGLLVKRRYTDDN